MASTLYGVNDNLAVKLWAKKLFVETLKETYVGRFIGKGSNSLVQFREELTKSKGDRIRIGLRMQLTGAGVQGDNTLEGNEEALTTYFYDQLIDQLRHAVRSAGKMSEQRVPFEVREEARSGLQDWWAGRLDYAFFNQITGNIAQTDVRYTGMVSAVAPDSAHIIRAGNVSDSASLSTGNVFNLTHLDVLRERARTATPVIRTVKQAGQEYYVCFLHPDQVYSMRTSTSTAQWADIQKAAMTGGEVKDNPIFTGALGIYNGIILHEAYRIPNAVSNAGAAVASTRRAVLCGAQAAIFACGQDNGPEKMTWNEELFDYQNQLGVEAGMIFGLGKTTFNSADFATVCLDTYAAQPVPA